MGTKTVITTECVETIRNNLQELPSVMMLYKTAIEGHEKDITIKHKTLEMANLEQPSLYSYYDQKRVELQAICEIVELKVSLEQGIAWKKYTEKHTRELSTRDKEWYLKQDTNVSVYMQIQLEVKEMLELYKSVVESLRIRGFVLTNLTKLKCSDYDNTLLL